MRIQARLGIRRWLARRGEAVSSAKTTFVFEDMGSIWRAATALRLPYRVIGRNAEGREEGHLLILDFVPLIGLLRGIDQLADEATPSTQNAEPRAAPNGGPAAPSVNAGAAEGPPSAS
jgi:hypothetical protein